MDDPYTYGSEICILRHNLQSCTIDIRYNECRL
jgi:hypothetical protein